MRRLPLILLLLAAGCATPEYTPITSFVVEPQIDVQKAEKPTGLTLGVRTLETSRAYRQPIAYLDDGLVLGTFDEYEWAELPSDIVTRALMDAITDTGKFQNVGLAAFMTRPAFTLTGQLRRFELNRTSQPWTAVAKATLTLRKSLEPQAVWSNTLEATAPLATNDVAALPEAMSEAVGKLASQTASAIAAAGAAQ